MRLVALATWVALATVARPAAAQSPDRAGSTILAGRATGLSGDARQPGSETFPRPGTASLRSEEQVQAGPMRVAPAVQAVAPRESWWSPVASALLPGSGQVLMGQGRAVAYLAVEGYGWIRYASDLREARRQRDEYRSLAVEVARAYFSDMKPVGDFDYYERMEHFVESGVFDASLSEGIQPETDPESYNGFIWLRARTTFWEDPAVPPPITSEPFSSAIRYYEERAIRPEFRWSWRNAQLEQDLFRRTIDRSNDAFRRSIQDLGVIIANHALSTVDAYVTVRIRHARSDPGHVGIEASIPW